MEKNRITDNIIKVGIITLLVFIGKALMSIIGKSDTSTGIYLLIGVLMVALSLIISCYYNLHFKKSYLLCIVKTVGFLLITLTVLFGVSALYGAIVSLYGKNIVFIKELVKINTIAQTIVPVLIIPYIIGLFFNNAISTTFKEFFFVKWSKYLLYMPVFVLYGVVSIMLLKNADSIIQTIAQIALGYLSFCTMEYISGVNRK